ALEFPVLRHRGNKFCLFDFQFRISFGFGDLLAGIADGCVICGWFGELLGWVLRLCGRAHLARHCTVGEKSGLEARLRTREVTGRDASLPAPC
ncbi:MAG: hypothetical protein KA443_01705, partial [Clostridia bacterium]|nr:hypothetical protein [Clostridia bacterium]